MTTIDYGKYGLEIGQKYYYGQGLWGDDCVVAWMPLPEPYKEGEKGGKNELRFDLKGGRSGNDRDRGLPGDEQGGQGGAVNNGFSGRNADDSSFDCRLNGRPGGKATSGVRSMKIGIAVGGLACALLCFLLCMVVLMGIPHYHIVV